MKSMWSTAGMFLVWAGMSFTVQVGDAAEDDRTEAELPVVFDRAVRLDDELFELWIFEGNRERFRRTLARQLETAVQTLDWKYGLAEPEKQKLVFAGQADMRRFFEEAEILRRKFRETCGDHRQLLLVHRETVKFRVDSVNGLFGESSFFAKVASRTLKDAASSRAGARRRQQLRSAADRAVVPLESIASLRPEQCEALVALLLAEAPPINVGDDDDVLMKYRLTEFSEEQLKPLFDEAQWPRVQVVLNVFQDYRAGLEARGLIDGRTGRLRTD